jgi:hypothetical protein
MKFYIIFIFIFYRVFHHQQTLKEMREVIRCVEANQREFVETIDVRCFINFILEFLLYQYFSVNTRYKSSELTI